MSTYCQPTLAELEAIDLAALRRELERVGFEPLSPQPRVLQHSYANATVAYVQKPYRMCSWPGIWQTHRAKSSVRGCLKAIAAVTDECPRDVARRLRRT